MTPYRVEIFGKPGFSDPAGTELLAQSASVGLSGAAEIRAGRIYEIVGRLSPAQVEQAARELLADPVTQDYRINEQAVPPAFLLSPHWRVEIWLKDGVSDPEEESLRKGLRDLGLPAPDSIRGGRVYKIVGRCQLPQIERVARKWLSNPLIHRSSVEAPR